MKNIVLIGMPGSGKSTTGVLLAKSMKMPFIDTDLLIQEKTGQFLHEIIQEKGTKAFLDIEEEVILNLEATGSIIATGGSAVLRQKAMEHLKENGLVVYIELPVQEIEKRIRNIRTRGIAMEKQQTLSEIYVSRVPLYEEYADITLHSLKKDLEKVVEELKKAIQNFCPF